MAAYTLTPEEREALIARYGDPNNPQPTAGDTAVTDQPAGVPLSGDPLGITQAAAGYMSKLADAETAAGGKVLGALGSVANRVGKAETDLVNRGVNSAAMAVGQAVDPMPDTGPKFGPPPPPANGLQPDGPIDASAARPQYGVDMGVGKTAPAASDASQVAPMGSASPQAAVTRPGPTSQAGGPSSSPGVSGPSKDSRVNRLYNNLKDEQKDVNKAQEELFAEQERERFIENAKLERQAQRHEQLVNDDQALTAKQQAEREEDVKRAEFEFNERKRLLREASDARVDPNHFWNSKSTGSQIAGAFAIALGGLGAAMARTPNFALNIIDNAIERDVKAQEFNVNQKWKAAEMQGSVYSDALKLYGSKEQARAAVRSEMYNRAQLDLDAFEARGVSDVAQQHIATMRAGLEARKAENDYVLLQHAKKSIADSDARAAAAANAERTKLTTAAEAEVKRLQENGQPVPDSLWRMTTLGRAGLPVSEASSAVSGLISNVPPKLQTEAIKELPHLKVYDVTDKSISEYQDVLRKYTATEAAKDQMTPGGSDLGNKKRLYESQFAGALRNPGDNTEQEFKRNVAPNFGNEYGLASEQDINNIGDALRRRNMTNNGSKAPILMGLRQGGQSNGSNSGSGWKPPTAATVRK